MQKHHEYRIPNRTQTFWEKVEVVNYAQSRTNLSKCRWHAWPANVVTTYVLDIQRVILVQPIQKIWQVFHRVIGQS